MKIFITPGALVDGSLYLEEVLSTFAPPCIERAPLKITLLEADPVTDLLILPFGSESNGVEVFLQAGGSVIAIRPDDTLLALAQLTTSGEREVAGRLRIVAPLCPAARGEALWTLGTQTIYSSELTVEEQAASTLAYLFEPGNHASESAGIFQRAVADGLLTVFAYDPAACITLLRQGRPERAGVLPEGDQVPRSTYLHDPQTPNDTAWRPTADLHAAALCDVVVDSLQRHAPAPRLWHIPAGKSAILLFTGDEDGAAQEINRLEMRDVESFDVNMSLYVIPEATSITRDDVEEYSRRGHEISVHPDMWPVCGGSVSELLAKAESDVLMFRKRYGQPVKTVRTHSGIWPGYLDLPELWERLNIEMDSSCLASLLYQSAEDGPYVHINAAMPLRFVRQDGSLIDVYEQPPHIGDDLSFHPTVDYSQKYSVLQSDWLIERMLEDAAHWFHAPFCVIIHPDNYATFSREQGKAFLKHAQKLDMPVWTLDRWNRFWRARASWRMSTHRWSGSRLEFSLNGTPGEQLCLTLPAKFDGKVFQALSFDGISTHFEIVERFKRPIAQAVLPADVAEVEVVAEYV